MRIGTLGYRTKTGLGYQVLSYVKHLPISKVLVIDLSGFNGMPLTDWYPNSKTVQGYPSREDLVDFLQDLDVVFLAETPLNYELYSLARKMGVKTATVHNYEFFDHFVNPHYPHPDMLISPSMWNYDVIDSFAKEHGVKHIYLHHPVDREEFKFKLRNTAFTMHIAGKPAAYDRNGTEDYLYAVPNGLVITQNDHFAQLLRSKFRHSRILTNIEEAHQMYEYGDILVLPRRYGGNCLPLNEALSCGLPVIMPDISPNNHLLPEHWLVPAKVINTFTPRTKIDIYAVDQTALAEKIEWFRTCDIAKESQLANEIAESISWETLRPKYMEALSSLVGVAV